MFAECTILTVLRFLAKGTEPKVQSQNPKSKPSTQHSFENPK